MEESGGWDPSWYTCCGNWTPDGRYFVFQSKGDIWALREKSGFLRRAGREPMQLTTGPLAAYWPLPSLDGKRLFISSYQARAEFIRYDLTSKQFVPDLPGISGNELEFSRDGKSITYISVPGGALLRSAPSGTGRVQLTSPPFHVYMPHWSPDGTRIAFMGGPASKPSRIYVVPASGGTPQQVTNGESGGGDGDPSWSPDGMSLVFGGAVTTPAPALYVVDLRTNRVSTLPGSEGMWSPRWSPDGRSIAGLVANGPKLMLYDMETRVQTDLYVSRRDPSGYPSWSPDGRFLFFLSDEEGLSRVRMLDRKVEHLATLTGTSLIGWGWLADTSNDSVMMARDISIEAIYALNWELP